ncbi:MAG: SDR family NAD(P)-dependent oxidoreductase, partial [Gammaproteobacteria bacterium]|nr:SDR family NAD(P)-dependent oxidoreductase [Gammaproteobacteria bacterium]
MNNKTRQTKNTGEPLAIVGIGCMFPQAATVDDYWSNIKEGVDAITEVPATHWKPDDYFDPDKTRPDMTYGRRGGFIVPVDFDPLLYGMSPNNIEATDTTQLLGMAVAREALLDAGYATAIDADDGRQFDRDRTSVILGVTGTLELVIPLGARLGHPIWRKALADAGVDDAVADAVVQRISEAYVPWQENSFPGLLGNVAAGRIANRFDLGGTNCVVDAACASSLSALHLASMELQSGRCDMAITGGLDTFNDIFMYMCFSKTPALSPTGNSRPFHANGDGTILGEGLGIVILKRLSDAQRDQDRIYAVIKGIGSSSDGKGNAIYAPSITGQQKALRNAYEEADVLPRTIELVEAHGTGTKVGDAVEATALSTVYRDDQEQGCWCAIGSVKSMIGHTKAAAGVAGLIKIAMALQHKVLPPTIKVDQPLQMLTPGAAPVYINTEKRPWVASTGHPRRAAVSAFGFGGSNFHCVLEEAASCNTGIDWHGNVLLFAFSGTSNDDINTQLSSLNTDLTWNEYRKMAAESLQTYDQDKHCRLIFVLEKNNNKFAKLLANAGNMLSKHSDKDSWQTPDGAYFGRGQPTGKLAMLFPGQGSQYVGMLRDLACQFPQMVSVLSAANNAFPENEHGKRLSDHIYPISVFNDEARAANETALRSTDIAQPAIGSVSLGALRIVQHFGIKAEASAGHSFGELTALCCAGNIDENSLYKLARKRGELMQRGDGDHGAMLAVVADASTLYTLIEEHQLDLLIANHNTPTQTVLSGATDQIDKTEALLEQRNIRARRLPVAAAFHSSFVADAERPFMDFLDSIEFQQNKLPVFANTTAQQYQADVKQARQLLAVQLTRPVMFVKHIENMYAGGSRTFIELGPANVLTAMVKSILKDKTHQAIALDASKGGKDGQFDLACVLARISTLGHGCDVKRWDAEYLHRLRPEKKPAMTISISGANYVMPRDKIRPVTKTTHTALPTATTPATQPTAEMSSNSTKHISNKDTLQANDALRATQQGILALQKMQEQTSQLHRQYLQGQEQAQLTIRQLIDQQTQLLTGLPLAPAPVAPVIGPVQQPVTTASTESIVDELKETPVNHAPVTNDNEPSTQDKNKYQNILLEVVAEKTGYPIDMLSLDMSLDTDLGIDSIKRVEILSALQEKIPGIQQIQAEQLGTFQLLQHIVEFLAAGDSDLPVQASEQAVTSQTVDNAVFQQALLEVVADKTGYPADMLNLDMNLDSDLGIDSIKRVEILSALQERLPEAPVVKPEDLGALQTLRQIVEFMAEGTTIQTAPVAKPAGMDSAVFQQVLLEVVADKTGYPADMLNLDMNLDSDLGIDSIKRVEILSALQERLPEAPAVKPEDLGSLQTLQQIVEHMQGHATTLADAEPAPTAVISHKKKESTRLFRSVVEVIPLSQDKRQSINLPDHQQIWITDDGSDLPGKICKVFQQQQLTAQVVSLSAKLNENVSALIILAPADADSDFVKNAFNMLQQAGNTTVLVTVTRLGGKFGIQDLSSAKAEAGAIAGLIKTADKEWPDVNCKALDIPVNRSNAKLAAAIAAEVLTQGPLELGITDEARYTLALNTAEFNSDIQINNPFSEDDVVVISGGARGVTAEIAFAMAETYHTKLLLLGRSPLPAHEHEWLSGLTDESTIKQAIINRSKDKKPTPKAIEEAYQGILAQREILKNLERIKATGVEVSYQPVDVRDAIAVDKIVNKARHDMGTIAGIIHGAGVLADRLIEDKTEQQFQQVYSTKVAGLQSLLSATEKDDLKIMVMFSSSTGRFGRKGQIDYAAANEALNKIAQHQQNRRSTCRVVSINWGPWDGGMITPQLKKIFENEGVGVIPLAAGADYLMHEIATKGPVEIVISGTDSEFKPGLSVTTIDNDFDDTSMHVAFERRLNIEDYPVLKSHVMNGKAVLPVALIVEWLAHGAMHNNPGLLFYGLDDLHIFKGVILENGETIDLQIFAGQMSRSGEAEIVPVELRSGKILHARASIVLTTDYSPQSPSDRPPIKSVSPYKNNDIYTSNQLFHGQHLQGIESIDACSEQGIVATVKAAPGPSQWMHKPIRSNWFADPLALDSSFQMMILWSFQNKGVGSLPTGITQ